MPNSLEVYDLGSKGVNVDSSPIHKEGGELTSAQNAVHNRLGVRGGLCKRLGLVKQHVDAGAASFLGGAAVPLGGGPGVTTDYTTYYVGDDADVASFNVGDSAKRFNITNSGSGELQIDTDLVAGPGVGPYLGCVQGNRLFYPGRRVAPTSTMPIVMVTPSTDAMIVGRIPIETGTISQVTAVQCINGRIFIGVVDDYTVTSTGRVFELDPQTFALVDVGPNLGADTKPTCFELHHGDLFVGTGRDAGADQARIFRIRLDIATTWTTDNTFAANSHTVFSLKSFNGLLYAAVDPVGGAGSVYQRSAAGVYATVDTGVAATSFPVSLEVFRGSLYASWHVYTGTTATIRSSANGTVWASVDTTRAGILYSTGGQLVVLTLQSYTSGSSRRTVNGSTWAAVSPTMSGGSVTSAIGKIELP